MKADDLQIATGNYINIYSTNGDIDIFIILNESNDEPTLEEYIKIEDKCAEIIAEYINEKIQIATELKTNLELAVEDLGLNCTEFGCQVVIQKYY